jgi:putative peptide zinc metalloprotease protein
MTETVRPVQASLFRPTEGLSLLGEYQGSGFAEPRFLVRRGDGQVIQLTRLLYLVTAAVAGEADGSAGDGGRDASQVAKRASAEFGRDLTADNIRYLVTSKLAPLGVVTGGGPHPPQLPVGDPHEHDHGDGHQHPHPPAPDGAPPPMPRSDLLLGLRVRGVLLRVPAVNAIGRGLAWLHYPALVSAVLALFVAFEIWLFALHGAIGPLLGVLQQPVLFLAVAGLTLTSLLFHEFGHASACRYGGGRPGVIGFGLYLIWPSLYTDVTDVYRLDRGGRLRTDLGGVYFNAIFILALGACYAATGQPVFLAAAFLDNFQILQQLFPLVRMDGYFILGDLAGVPDLLGMLGPIMASVLPGSAARRAGARARGLRRGPRVLVTTWVLVAIPLLGAAIGYTLWNLPVLLSTGIRSFTGDVAVIRAGFATGHVAAGLNAVLDAALLTVLPLAGLIYLLVRLATRGVALAGRALRAPKAGRKLGLAVAVIALSATAGAALTATGVLRPGLAAPGAADAAAQANETTAAAWIAQQVGPDVTVSCDPKMCGQLQRDGFPARALVSLPPTAGSLLGSSVVVATPALREQFGTSLAVAYAPLILASFGSGADQVQVRAVAPHGAAAFEAQLASEHAALVSAGLQLLRNKNIQVSAAARRALVTGQVDSRLFGTLSVLASEMPLRLIAFTDAAPGAGSSVPLRGVEIGAASPSALSAALAFLRTQQSPYRPATAVVARGADGLSYITTWFDAPSPISGGSS